MCVDEAMGKVHLSLFDTTLRDGAQTHGVTFDLEEKQEIAQMLDELGIDYIEGGYPGANPVDTAFFSEGRPELSQACFTAFGMTRRAGRSVENDPDLGAILSADAQAVCLVGKSSPYHVECALGISLEENLESIGSSIEAACARKREAMLDAEHFFDAYKSDPDYAFKCLTTALEAGARWVVLCDTNGGTLPHEVGAIVSEIAKKLPDGCLGIHAHNDTGNAVANTLAAVRAGVRQVQGTLNGLGERCGNANLITLIPTLALKCDDAFDISVKDLKKLTVISRRFDALLNRPPSTHAPYVGEAAFAHKGGIHVSAVLKDPRTYEHIPPETVGNRRRLPVSSQSGKSALLVKLKRLGIVLDPKDPKLATLLGVVKQREAQGYAYDQADASFHVLARQHLGLLPEFFSVNAFRVMAERRFNALGKLVTVASATVTLVIDGNEILSAAEGRGPVHALDNALRKDFGKYSDCIRDLRLVDYRVHILHTGTEAVTRVLITSGDDKGRRWFTLGASPNIIDASFQAMCDSLTYKILLDPPS